MTYRPPMPHGQPPVISRFETINGVYQASLRRGGYVVPDAAGIPDIRIPPMAVGSALHGDHVQVAVTKARAGHDPKGQITRVLKHANHKILGRLIHAGRYGVVHPKNQRINRVVEIHRRLDPVEFPEGCWVIAEVKQWSSGPDEPLVGVIAEVLGPDDQPGLPILLLVREGGITPEFPPEVEAEAAALLARAITREALAGRRDLREERIVTIDPARAKDFDDAVGLVRRVHDGWRVGVHIADVAHYVRPESAVDTEAYERATSIYPVDRVIPMLPEALSNQICSLRPDEDRLTMSAEFTISPAGEISDVELYASVIRSARRFAYEEVQGVFEAADEEAGVEIAPRAVPHPRPALAPALLRDLLELRQAARALGGARMRRGALDLDLPETEILFDSERRVTDLRRAERFEAHRLIEEFMIAANEAVARELERRGLPALYRIHAEPAEEKLRIIAPVLARLGIPVPTRGGISRTQLQTALTAARKHPAGTVVQRWVLRAMKRALYQPENIGHYGLASTSYVHFTSPIRRYPDLLIHRVVKALLEGTNPENGAMTALAEALPLWGRHTSQREERAQRIEWDAQKLLGLDFMRRYLGDIFAAFISGVSPMGFYVELVDYPVEGLVRIGQMDDDFYDLDEETSIWRGRASGRTFALGDPLSVMIERIDVLAGQMDLVLVRAAKKRRQDRQNLWQKTRAAAAPRPFAEPRAFRRAAGAEGHRKTRFLLSIIKRNS